MTICFASCNKDQIKGSGSTGSRTIAVPAFSSVEAYYDIDAAITYGAVQELIITGYDNLLNILDVKVENGSLKLKYKTKYNRIRNNNVKATIKIPLVSKAGVYGSGDITISGFATGNLLNAGIYGSGKIEMSNSTYQNAIQDVYGSGNIDVGGVQTKEATVNVHGSGNTYVSASDKLVAKIFGSGNVYYRGNPEIETTRNGSGRVIKQ